MKTQLLIKDVEYLLKRLPKVHKDLYALISKEEFDKTGQEIINSLAEESYTNSDFIIILMRLFAKIKDTHTTIYTNDHKLPLFFEWVNGEYYPFVINRELGELLGKKLISIDGLALDIFIKKAQEYIIFDNEEIKKVNLARTFVDYDLIKFITKNTNEFVTFEFEGGKTAKITYEKDGETIWQTSIFNIKGNEYIGGKSSYFVENKDGNFYFKYSRCSEDKVYKFKELFKDIKSALGNKPKKLIVDLRYNQGGNSSLFNPILTIFNKYIKKENPKVYCLINRRVFSSGVLNTYDMKYKCGALLVGQPTGQGVNHYGEVKYLTLPNTKIEVQYSSKFFKLIDEDSTTIKPDILIEPDIADYMTGNDPVLKYCMNN